MAVNFGFKRKAQECTNEHDQPKKTDTFEGQRRYNRCNDVGTDQNFETQQDTAPQIGAVTIIGILFGRRCQVTKIDARCNRNARRPP